MNTKAYTLYILEYNNSAVEGGRKKMIFQNILNANEQREKIKANQSTSFFFVLLNWFLKAPLL